FESDATNLVSSDTNGITDVFARARCAALWSNYGSGFAGTNGVPAFTSQSDPVLGSTLSLSLANSLGAATSGLLFVGSQQASIPTSLGGVLLVIPSLTLFVSVPAAGATF